MSISCDASAVLFKRRPFDQESTLLCVRGYITYKLSSRALKRLVRTFTIPEGTKAGELQANYRYGVLELTLPLPASLLPKKAPIVVESQANGQQQIDAPK